jgi:ABC-type antimicrobial peptide transport system permease subunit
MYSVIVPNIILFAVVLAMVAAIVVGIVALSRASRRHQ